MKKFSPPQMKEVSFPTPYTPHPLSTAILILRFHDIKTLAPRGVNNS
jgi:hypothetical protein